MAISPYDYAAQSFGRARIDLMLPHSRGEAESIGLALGRCFEGLGDVVVEDLDDESRQSIRLLRELMDTSDVNVHGEMSTYELRARAFGNDQKILLRNAVDQLATKFDRLSGIAEELR